MADFKMGWDKLRKFLSAPHLWTGKQTFSDIEITGGSITIDSIADTTLSGTPRVFVIYDGETPYYFKAYPTKL